MSKGENKNLHSFFEPKSIAIVGASADEKKIGNIVLKNIEKSGYSGDIFLVNKHGAKIGQRHSQESYFDLPKVPELAIIATPADAVCEIVRQVGEKGTKNIVIFAAGFRETGPLGEKLEEQLMKIAGKFQINILGPNCLGFLNSRRKLNATFGQVPRRGGTIRFASQSGALATSLFDWAESTGLGFKEFVTLGNKAGLTENDLLGYWSNQEKKPKNLEPVGLYLESIADGKKFVEVASALARITPVVLLKPGHSLAASEAMLSHTGALAGDNDVLDTALSSAGVIRANGVEDLFDYLKVFAWEKAPEGPKVAIVSNAGGAAVVAADAIDAAGLELAGVSNHVRKTLQKYLPRAASIHNPIDVLGDALADRYRRALEAVLKEREVNSVIVILTPQAMTQIEATAKVITTLSRRYKKTILCSFMGGVHAAIGEQLLNEAKIPSFRYPERAVQALGKMWQWRAAQKNRTTSVSYQTPILTKHSLGRITSIAERAAVMKQPALSGFEANVIIKEAGLHVPAFEIVTTKNDAEDFAKHQHFPVALKISSPEILHKSELHGLIIGITSQVELAAGYEKMRVLKNSLARRGVKSQIMVQKHAPGGVEIIVGVKRDKNFGLILLIGAGGIFTEILSEKVLHLLPIDKKTILKLIQNSKVGKILGGLRGERPYAVEKLAETIMNFCSLASSVPVLREMEINPIIVTHDNVFAIDAKILL